MSHQHLCAIHRVTSMRVVFVFMLLFLRTLFIPDLLCPNKSACHPLMINNHQRHRMSPSWSTLFSPILLKDYSRVPPALPAWLSSTSHIDRANIKRCLFTHRQKRREINHKTFIPWVKSICLSKSRCWHTMKTSRRPLIFIPQFRVLWMWLVCWQGRDW